MIPKAELLLLPTSQPALQRQREPNEGDKDDVPNQTGMSALRRAMATSLRFWTAVLTYRTGRPPQTLVRSRQAGTRKKSRKGRTLPRRWTVYSVSYAFRGSLMSEIWAETSAVE